MTKQHAVSGTVEIYTYRYLWETGETLLKQAELAESSDKFDLNLAALLFYYLAYEAFINFSGEILLPKIWQNERNYFRGKKSGLESKVKEIVEELHFRKVPFTWEKEKPPYRKIKKLKDFRDALSHAKIKVKRYQTALQGDGSHIRWKLPWEEFIAPNEIIDSRDTIKTFCQSLVIAMRQCSDHSQFKHNAMEGSLVAAQGTSIPE